MGNFDFENYNLIGSVDILPNGNANIKAIGYVNYRNDLHILTSRKLGNVSTQRAGVCS